MALEAVLVLVFVLLPGVVADAAYRFLTWRPEPTDQGVLVRATAISFAALFGLIILETTFPYLFSVPVYLRPDWWRRAAELPDLPWPVVLKSWLQHAVVAVSGAVALGMLVRWRPLTGVLRRVLGRSLYSSAWDEFAVQHIGRWVLVTLTDGRVFYGALAIASGDRRKDVVLYRPMPFNPDTGSYQFTGNKAIFVREDQVQSVLVPLDSSELAAVQDRLGVYRLSTGERVDVQTTEASGAGGPEAPVQ
ncbi:MAG: hypothetical protein HYT81_10380 [Gemmatimonadetes bacterium]|nr:hypothetical protein [Gemmatimonadota bacterium]